MQRSHAPAIVTGRTLVLHGSWLPAAPTDAPLFALWAEEVRPGRRGGRARATKPPSAPPRHPFAASTTALREAIAPFVPASNAAPYRTLDVVLPSADASPVPSSAIPAGAPALSSWRVEALTLDAAQASTLLIALAGERGTDTPRAGDDLRFWAAATRFALSLLRRQRLLPTLLRDGDRFLARWQPLYDDQEDARFLRTLAAAMPHACRALALADPAAPPAPEALLRQYLGAVVDALARSAAPRAPSAKRARRRAPGDAWLDALRGDPVVAGRAEDLAAFAARYDEWQRSAETPAADTFRLCFRLEPPPAAEDADAEPQPSSAWTLRYLLQAADDPSLLVPLGEVWRQRGDTARFLDRAFDRPQERVLAGLGRAARLFPPIDASLHSARPDAVSLPVDAAHAFMREHAPLLQAGGFGVLVPKLETKLGLRARLGGTRGRPAKGDLAGFGWETLVEYDWQIALGDEPLSRAEFEALAALKQPLVQVRGRWVELRPDQVAQALAVFERAAGGRMALPEALALALAPDGAGALPVIAVEATGAFGDLLATLRGGERRGELPEPPGFEGSLREYQRRGVAWLASLRRYGIGACLADDMGLGKTVQLIALLLHARSDAPAPGPALLICPTSVVGNWRRELARFAPGLRVLVYHGAARSRDQFAGEAGAHDVVISTYSLLHRDEAALAAVAWDALVLDEAQNIKNPGTRAAQAARALPARWRAALTGTPVENRLSELWSIFQFLNPGYLGSAERFRARLALPIERTGDPAATARLKSLTTPFILRRLKTDRSIIRDLPAKNEMKVFCTLTREQATLYQAVLQESMRAIEEAEGIDRRGQILAALTRLKQVCDHPALFLQDGCALPGRSGKLARLTEMLEEVLAVGDRALVFTQYAEMGKLLKRHLEASFSREALFLYGGTAAAERDRMVERFQGDAGPQLFILSIKAGGTGLNLTRANHVFHFDRWWNPAVENQATDRAFRIGQRRDVQVHKFICAGTFEEALDGIIERKLTLAEAIVGAGESWITEMNTEQLGELFALRRDAMGEE